MNLTQEQRNTINAFIAEKCGWMHLDTPKDGITRGVYNGSVKPIPDYCTSLDACHEAEKTLKGDQWIGYVRLLGEATQEEKGRCHATAEQRAIALFQTLGGVL